MAARVRTRRADAKGRVILFSDFANASVLVERVSENEVRIKKVPAIRRPTLEQIVSGFAAVGQPGEVDFGPSIGKEIVE